MSMHDDAMREWAWNVGNDPSYVNNQWMLSDYDVWVRNPHYTGPAQPHPEYDREDVELETTVELAEHLDDLRRDR